MPQQKTACSQHSRIYSTQRLDSQHKPLYNNDAAAQTLYYSTHKQAKDQSIVLRNSVAKPVPQRSGWERPNFNKAV